MTATMTELPRANKRDVDLLTLLAEGKKYKEIAHFFKCNQCAVHQRMRRLMVRFGTHNSAHTVAYAIRRGIIS